MKKRYKVPCRTHFSGSEIPNLLTQVKTEVKTLLKGVGSLAITTDCWTSTANEPFIATSGHFIDKQWRLIEVQLACSYFEGSHTGEAIAQKVQEALKEMAPTATCSAMVSDSAPNMKNCGTRLSFPHLSCACHDLQLAINDALKEAGLDVLLKKCRAVVGHFKHSAKESAALKKAILDANPNAKVWKVKQDVPTRWNSTFLMLQRLDLLGAPITTVLYRNQTKKIQDNFILTPSELLTVKHLVEILGPMEEITRGLSGASYSTLSMVYPIMSTLVTKLPNPPPEGTEALVNKLKETITSRFLTDFDVTTGLACFLDPRFKALSFLREDWKELVLNAIKEELKKAPVAQRAPKIMKTSSNSIFGSLASSLSPATTQEKDELEKYLDHPITIEESEFLTFNVFQFWKSLEATLPGLASVAKKILAVPASSVPVERFFSKAGLIVTKKRASLSANKVEALMFLGVNLKFFNE